MAQIPCLRMPKTSVRWAVFALILAVAAYVFYLHPLFWSELFDLVNRL